MFCHCLRKRSSLKCSTQSYSWIFVTSAELNVLQICSLPCFCDCVHYSNLAGKEPEVNINVMEILNNCKSDYKPDVMSYR